MMYFKKRKNGAKQKKVESAKDTGVVKLYYHWTINPIDMANLYRLKS